MIETAITVEKETPRRIGLIFFHGTSMGAMRFIDNPYMRALKGARDFNYTAFRAFIRSFIVKSLLDDS